MYIQCYCFQFSLTLIPADSVQLNPFLWEPLVLNEPVVTVPSPTIEETASSNDHFPEQSQFTEPGLSPISHYTGNICARDSANLVNGAVCKMEPQCEDGRKAMCCTRVSEYGRPTECTPCVYTLMSLTLETDNLPPADDPGAFKCTSERGEYVYCCTTGFIVGILLALFVQILFMQS